MTALPEVLEKLESCPFCGREATVENPEQGCYAIGCDDCCFSMMAGNVGIGWYATRAEAITAWNTRPALLRDAGYGWQSIESAPKDGTRVMLYFPKFGSGGDYTEAGKWETQPYSRRPKAYWSGDGERSLGVAWYREFTPTHWRPLPQPPAMPAPGGAGESEKPTA